MSSVHRVMSGRHRPWCPSGEVKTLLKEYLVCLSLQPGLQNGQERGSKGRLLCRPNGNVVIGIYFNLCSMGAERISNLCYYIHHYNYANACLHVDMETHTPMIIGLTCNSIIAVCIECSFIESSSSPKPTLLQQAIRLIHLYIYPLLVTPHLCGLWTQLLELA